MKIGPVVLTAKRPDDYRRDGLRSIHNHSFIDDPEFDRAYRRGVRAIGGTDRYRFQWRAHVALWAAATASRIEGDFVECGVNYGFMSSAIMEYLDWDTLGKTFWLLDTFSGVDSGQASEKALMVSRKLHREGFYADGVDVVRRNFSEWRNHRIVVGAIPGTLDQVEADRVAFLHIDMNCAPPEVAALRHFWPKLTPGAPVLLDDYAYAGFEEQHAAMDELAAELGVTICSLPTGQGLLLKS